MVEREKCLLCCRGLKIEIISPLPNLKYVISDRNITTIYGGIFCCYSCGRKHIQNIEKMLLKYKKKIIQVIRIQRWWKELTC